MTETGNPIPDWFNVHQDAMQDLRENQVKLCELEEDLWAVGFNALAQRVRAIKESVGKSEKDARTTMGRIMTQQFHNQMATQDATVAGIVQIIAATRAENKKGE